MWLDPLGIITSCNSGAQALTRLHADEFIGQHCSRFYFAEDIERAEVRNRAWSLSEKKDTRTTRLARAQGRHESFWANVVATAFTDQSGNLRGFRRRRGI